MSTAPRLCEWCQGAISHDARKDASTCSKKCRQAKQRFRIAPAEKSDGRALTFAYADPPYPGLSKRYYEEHPQYAGEVDHRELIARMVREFPDGWALSTSSDAMLEVLGLCRELVPRELHSEVRVPIWAKGSRSGVSYRPRDAYEPVIVFGGRPRRLEIGQELDNVLVWGGRQHSHPGALVGMKPAAFAEWMFRQLGAQQGDELHDLFPGSGAIGRAWKLYTGGRVVEPPQLSLFPEEPSFVDRKVPSRLDEAAERLRERTAEG